MAFFLLALQPLLFFRSVLITRTRHIPFDIEAWHLPIASFMARCAREHIFPFWNPYDACGAPAYTDIQAQLFYPPTWIALLLGNLSQGEKLFYWLQALIPLHMFLGGLFTFLLVRRLRCSVPIALFAGTSYELSAFFASQTQHLVAICAAAWFPLLLLCAFELAEQVTTKWIGITALATALSVLAGFPQCTIVALVFVILFAVALAIVRIGSWKAVAALLAGLALGGVICAVQLIPTFQAVTLSMAALRSTWLAKGGGLPWQSLVSFVWPNFYHVFDTKYSLPFNATFLYTYCGHIAALLILLAPLLLVFRLRGTTPERKLLGISFLFVMVSTIWMLGEATPIYESIYERLGSLRGSLYAGFALMAFCLWVAVTAALALSALKLRNERTVAWVIALLAAINLIAVSSYRPLNTAHGSYRSANSEYTIAGDLSVVEAMQSLTSASYPSSRMEFLAPDSWPLRAGAQMYRIPSAVADDPFNTLRYYYFRLSFAKERFWDRMQILTTASSPWLDAMNDAFVIVGDDTQPLPVEKFERVPLAGIHVWRNKTVLPRFYLVDRVRHAADMEAARTLLPRITEPGREAIVEKLRPDWAGSGLPGSSVKVVNYQLNRVELLVHASGPSYLVTSEALYPGWRTTANGRPVELLPTNVAFRGMPVSGGDTRIVMSYRQEYFALSILITLIGLVSTAALLVKPTQGIYRAPAPLLHSALSGGRPHRWRRAYAKPDPREH